jgi:hypothetical protein
VFRKRAIKRLLPGPLHHHGCGFPRIEGVFVGSELGASVPVRLQIEVIWTRRVREGEHGVGNRRVGPRLTRARGLGCRPWTPRLGSTRLGNIGETAPARGSRSQTRTRSTPVRCSLSVDTGRERFTITVPIQSTDLVPSSPVTERTVWGHHDPKRQHGGQSLARPPGGPSASSRCRPSEPAIAAGWVPSPSAIISLSPGEGCARPHCAATRNGDAGYSKHRIKRYYR